MLGVDASLELRYKVPTDSRRPRLISPVLISNLRLTGLVPSAEIAAEKFFSVLTYLLRRLP
jgi:hypothetical protein